MGGGGRADAAEAIGGGRGESTTIRAGEGGEQFQRQRMIGHAQADRVLPAGDGIRHLRLALENQCERPRPEGGGELLRLGRHLARPARHVRGGGQMDDKRVVGRAALGGEDLGHGGRIGGVGAEAVDGLGGESDQPALGQGSRRCCHGSRASRQNRGFQANIHCD